MRTPGSGGTRTPAPPVHRPYLPCDPSRTSGAPPAQVRRVPYLLAGACRFHYSWPTIDAEDGVAGAPELFALLVDAKLPVSLSRIMLAKYASVEDLRSRYFELRPFTVRVRVRMVGACGGGVAL
ncbi:Hypothetical protein NTJ_02371 [Nesidiocoris tenuis]|uniref:Uncharacterized protein n=1 Tax=Nesidiocoris tenuis TaxID=355587 RepID=A0ABN7AEF4_9HEMI|nr:Hypothetical protein NTJ_02371 [Nesidiocoris tenuis]